MGTLILTAVLEQLSQYDWEDTVFVPEGSDVRPTTPVKVIKLEENQPVRDALPGYEYFLEVGVMRENVEDMDGFLMRSSTIEERAWGVIHYAKYDAHITLSQLREHVPAPLGFAFKENSITHSMPAWMNRADSFIDVHHDDPRFPRIREQLSVRNAGNGKYEICSVPFLGLFALGDTVMSERNHDGSMCWRRCASAGHNTHRLLLKYAAEGAARIIEAELARKGEAFEWYSPDYLAVDRKDPLSYTNWAAFFAHMRKEYGVLEVA